MRRGLKPHPGRATRCENAGCAQHPDAKGTETHLHSHTYRMRVRCAQHPDAKGTETQGALEWLAAEYGAARSTPMRRGLKLVPDEPVPGWKEGLRAAPRCEGD